MEQNNKNEIFIQSNWAKHNLDISAAIIHNMATSVKNSFGPVGASTLMVQEVGEKSYTATVTKDGYSIISKLNYFHPAAVAMKRLLLESMLGVLSTAGDGTTTTTILIDNMTRAFINDKEFYDKYPAQVIVNSGKNVVKYLSESMRALGETAGETSIADIHGIINTTVNGDAELRQVVSDVIGELGTGDRRLDDISISYTPSPNNKTTYKIESGYVVPRATSFEAHTGNRKSKAKILLVNRSIATADEFRGLLAFITKLIKNQLTVAQGDPNKIEKTLIVTYNINNKEVLEEEFRKIKHSFRPFFKPDEFPISILIYGEDGTVQGKNEHDDFEYLLGQGVAYDITNGVTLKDLFIEGIPDDVPFKEDALIHDYLLYMHECNKLTTATVEYNKTSTIISDIKPIIAQSKETLIERLQEELDDAKAEDKFYIRQRIAKVDGKFAVIEIGGENEWDIKRKQDAIDDVVGAIRLAVKSPVCGGLSSFLIKSFPYDNIKTLNKLEQKLVTLIYDSYIELIKSLLGTCKMSDELIKSILLDMTNNDIVDKSKFVRKSFDIRKYIELITEGIDAVDKEDISSYEILNTVEAEIKILEASMNAMLTLVSINQISLPDQYDTQSYKNGNL